MVVVTLRCGLAILIVDSELALRIDTRINGGRVPIVAFRWPGTTIGVIRFDVVTHLGDGITNIQGTRVVVVTIEITGVFRRLTRIVDTTFVHHSPFDRHVKKRVRSVTAFAVDTRIHVAPDAVITIDFVFAAPGRLVGAGAGFDITKVLGAAVAVETIDVAGTTFGRARFATGAFFDHLVVTPQSHRITPIGRTFFVVAALCVLGTAQRHIDLFAFVFVTIVFGAWISIIAILCHLATSDRFFAVCTLMVGARILGARVSVVTVRIHDTTADKALVDAGIVDGIAFVNRTCHAVKTILIDFATDTLVVFAFGSVAAFYVGLAAELRFEHIRIGVITNSRFTPFFGTRIAIITILVAVAWLADSHFRR